MNNKLLKLCIFGLLIMIGSGLLLLFSFDNEDKKNLTALAESDDVKEDVATRDAADHMDGFKPVSEMNDDEIVAFLKEYDIAFNLEDEETRGLRVRLLKTYIGNYEKYGDLYCGADRPDIHFICVSLKTALDSYYDGKAGTLRQPMYTPTQNTFVYCPPNCAAFNCYGYAVELYTWAQPGFSNNLVYNLGNTSVYTLATYVKTDLQSSYLDQDCVKITSSCPTYQSLLSGQKAICIRKGSNGTDYDFHLMKLTSSGWYHKPGAYAVLKLNYAPPYYSTWKSECTTDGITWYLGSYMYTGNIYYIIYKPSHSYSQEYTGNNYHSGAFHYYEYAYVCSACGHTYGAHYTKIKCSGPPCPVPVNALTPKEAA